MSYIENIESNSPHHPTIPPPHRSSVLRLTATWYYFFRRSHEKL
ncbi:hypothetical protein [Tolypothrix sp. VBCCA 56010]